MVAILAAHEHVGFGGEHFGFLIDFAEFEAHAHDGVLLALLEHGVGGGDEGVVGQELEAGVAEVELLGAVDQPHAILAFAALCQVVVGAHPGHEVAAGGAALAGVAEDHHEASVAGVAGHVAVAGLGGGHFAQGRPRPALVVAEHDEGVVAAAVFARDGGKLLAIGRADDGGLAGAGVPELADEPLGAPREAAVVAGALPDCQGRAVAVVRAAVILHQVALAAVDRHDGDGDDDAVKAVLRHRRPCLALVLGDGLLHVAVAGEDEEACLALGVDQAMDGGAVADGAPVVGHGEQLAPGEAAVVAALHRAAVSAVVDGPHGEDGLPIGHQQGVHVALVERGGAACHHDLAFGLGRQVDGGDRVGDGLGTRLGQRRRVAHHREVHHLHRAAMGADAHHAERPVRRLDADRLLTVDDEAGRLPLADHLQEDELALAQELGARPAQLRATAEERPRHEQGARGALEAEVAAVGEVERRGAPSQLADSEPQANVEVALPHPAAGVEEVVGAAAFQVAFPLLPGLALLAHEHGPAIADEHRFAGANARPAHHAPAENSRPEAAHC